MDELREEVEKYKRYWREEKEKNKELMKYKHAYEKLTDIIAKGMAEYFKEHHSKGGE